MRRIIELRNKLSLTEDELNVVVFASDEYIPVSRYRYSNINDALMSVSIIQLHLHMGMFLPVLEAQASEEQKAAWLEDARQLRIIGCYAQTEMGHGSNLSGLETTATLDKATDEWIIHSPHLSVGDTSTCAFWIDACVIHGE
jgi:hypothetical protein